jgi:hypothetical protein
MSPTAHTAAMPEPRGSYEVQVHHLGHNRYAVVTLYFPPPILISNARLPNPAAALDHAERTRDLVTTRTRAPVTVVDKGFTLPPNWLLPTRPRES